MRGRMAFLLIHAGFFFGRSVFAARREVAAFAGEGFSRLDSSWEKVSGILWVAAGKLPL
jgi:hypothetical protein